MTEHVHHWEQHCATIEGVDCLSRWQCSCGAHLYPHEIDEILNGESTVDAALAERAA